MRVASRSIYDLIKYRVGNLAEELHKTNQVINTGKRINKLSDDPVAMTRVMEYKSDLSNIDQLKRNISTGRAWLDIGEIALNSVKDIIDETKVLALAMKNDTVNPADRINAAGQVDLILKQMTELANTRVNGKYIFAGTNTTTKPFALDDPENPTTAFYSGNEDPFTVKTGKDTTLAVGHNGEAVFGDKYITVDETNNTLDFRENKGGVTNDLTVEIPGGRYTSSELAKILATAMTDESAVNGNGIGYAVSYDEIDKQFAIEDPPGGNDLDQLQLLWKSGANASNSIGSDLGFDTSKDSDTLSTVGYSGQKGVQWGIFKTLIDLKGALENNDPDRIDKSLTRLDTHFEHINDVISAIGSKGVSLDVKENVIADFELKFQENKAKLEDADMLEAISDLNAAETIYQAALASSARVMKLSLTDYL